ncbi:MAG: thioredoxin fold domain-containing protein [Candidatus Sedimenticola sp. (ex Thyasira tokunagai)]
MRKIPYLILSLLMLLPMVSAAEDAAPQAEHRQGRFLGAQETTYPDWFKASFMELGEDVQEAADEGKRVMLFFHQDGCPYCNLMVERNLSQKDIQDTMKEKLDVIEINMWGDREIGAVNGKSYTEKLFAEALKVQFTPTLLFLDETGRVVLRLNGYIPPHNFKVALDYVNGHKEKETSYRKYLASRQPAAAAGELHNESFFAKPPYDLSKGEKPVALFFEQPQCPNCDKLHKEVLTDPAIRELVGRFDAIQLDMWSNTPVITPDGKKTTARKWARELEVNFAPSVVLLDRQQGEVIRSEAVFKRFHTESIFDYLLSGGFKHQPSFQRYITERAEAIREQGRDVNLWK